MLIEGSTTPRAVAGIGVAGLFDNLLGNLLYYYVHLLGYKPSVFFVVGIEMHI